MTGADLLCKILEKKGVECVFGLFGDIETDFAHALRKSKITWVGVHNEKSGGFMADIYSRVSKKVGIVFSTVGPGATNLTTALANATQDRSSIIAISDQVPIDECSIETHQYIDTVKAFAPETGITKHTEIVRKVEDLPEVFERAFIIANTEPLGAVHISIPSNFYGQKVVAVKKKTMSLTKKLTKLNLSKLNTFSNNLNQKRTGLVIAGGSIERSNAQEEFKEFIEKYKLPVLATFRGKNSLPGTHPQYLGTISRHLVDVVKEVINEVDYILTIGYDYNEGVKPSIWSGKTKVFNIDSYDNRVKNIFEPKSIFGNINKILANLTKKRVFEYKENFNFSLYKQKIEDTINKSLDVSNKNLHPGRIIQAVNKLYSEDSVIICDIGLNKYYSGLLLKSGKSNQILFSNGMSTMAFTSGALGAKIADSRKKVIALVGDGGFLMDLQEVITSIQYQKPIVWVVFNNGGLGLIEQAQLKNGPTHHGVKFAKVIFTQLGEALGLYSYKVKENDDIYEILKKALDQDRSAIIDVPVDYNSY